MRGVRCRVEGRGGPGRWRRQAGFALLFLGVLFGLGCGTEEVSRQEPQGLILISVSGLRADALDAEPSSFSPFLDTLSQQGLVYERVIATSPDTLGAHVSLLSGLYPAEHRVVPLGGTLSADVPVVPEVLSDYGFQTAGFTSGGYLSSDFGFDRGFDEFAVSKQERRSPFRRAIGFLRRLEGRSFFLFVHSDALEDALNAASFKGAGGEVGAIDLNLRRFASGVETLTAESAGELSHRYTATLASVDQQIEALFGELDALGLRSRTAVAITADHGFEFGEHGRVGHSQVYPETHGVPLMLVGPGLPASRVSTLVQTVDIAPSIYALAGLPMPNLSGVVLPGVVGSAEPRCWAAIEARGRWEQRSLLLEVDGTLYQAIESRLRGEHDGTWVTRDVTFDTDAAELNISIVSFHQSRRLRVLIDGEVVSELEIVPDWVEEDVPLGRRAGTKRVSLVTESCDSPVEVGAGPDRRCLSFKLRGQDLSRFELFDLDADPGARIDISRERVGLADQMRTELARMMWQQVAPPGTTQPRPGAVKAITLRGEYPEPPRP